MAGASAAGALATAAGATTLLGSTTLASALGGIFVATTPIGWVVGTAAAGAATGYGIARLARSGGKYDRIRQELIRKLSRKRLPAGNSHSDELECILADALDRGLISKQTFDRIRDSVVRGELPTQTAVTRLKGLAES